MKFEFDYQCDKEWDEMKGGDRRRYCDSCDKHVHHISGMTKKQALEFLEKNNWECCVDFYTDQNGNTEFKEERRLLQADGVRQLLASALAVVPLALGAAFIDFDSAGQREEIVVAPIDTDGDQAAFDALLASFGTSEEAVRDYPMPVLEPPPDVVPQPPVEPVELVEVVDEVEEVPVVEEVDEVEVEPAVPIKRPHVRGRIRRPDFEL